MAISVTELVTDVKNELGFNFSSEAHTDAKLKAYVNKAIRKLDRSADWIHKVKKASLITDGVTESYAVPFQKQTLGVLVWERPVSYSTLEEYYLGKSAFAIQEETVLTKLAATFTIVYRAMTDRISTVVSGNVDLPEYCFEALYHASCYYGFMNVKDFERMREHERLFAEEIKRLKNSFGDMTPNELDRLSENVPFH